MSREMTDKVLQELIDLMSKSIAGKAKKKPTMTSTLVIEGKSSKLDPKEEALTSLTKPDEDCLEEDEELAEEAPVEEEELEGDKQLAARLRRIRK